MGRIASAAPENVKKFKGQTDSNNEEAGQQNTNNQ